jgi:hypothetical protein
MRIVNTTPMEAGYTMATDKNGRESAVVVVKGTYRLPDGIPNIEDGTPALLKPQVPLTATDVFNGEPGPSAVRYENDFAPLKPRCDVLLNGSCHAPGGRPVTQVCVALRIGTMTKAFRVVGRRTYIHGLITTSVSAPEPFTTIRLGYEVAYGGIDRLQDDPTRHAWYPQNHAGVGFHPTASSKQLDGSPLPLTEELDRAADHPQGRFRPMSFGVIGRAWAQRIQWAGTYDQQWLDHQFPFLPNDFDPRYFQSAPDDQQIAYPRGGERVDLLHLTPQGRATFRLPSDLALPVVFLHRDGDLHEVPAVVDTLIIEPDEGRFMVVWRAALPLRRNIRELDEVIVGRSKELVLNRRAHLQRLRHKRRFKSLAQAVEWATELRQRQPA